ncbi:Glutathione-S-transferase domain-containing protein [Candidatus Terasakiella magnetica]|uniref:Glutathione-S-transferase domain-containing protein n=1 Tax=Candidatus Terasakiella magnetica TaxID=1867952 RepID=A0A1C3RDP1_9PROT|nr:glutathione S-transferase [Candidatus Terasakiella magnetica]SCA55389.1 Glutathione-S-transferase domain-containing protein [Candidatus Terasakiella magnetica]
MTGPVLYSFRRCPYAMRARLAIYASGVSVELREVVLRDKPAQMLQASPKGTVPVLVLPDGQVIEESLEIMQWALAQNDPEGWLKGDEGEVLGLITRNDQEFKSYLDRYKYSAGYEDMDPIEQRNRALPILQDLNQRLDATAYLCGEAPSLADYAIFPFIRQFAHVDLDWFCTTEFNALQNWFETLKNGVLFKAIMKKYPQWKAGDEKLIFRK